MRYCTIFILLLFSQCLRAQTLPPVPERIVSIDCNNRRVDEVMKDISTQAKFEFVWSSGLFDPARTVTLHEKNITVRRAIHLLFGNSITYKVRNNYIILQPAPAPIATNTGTTPRKQEYTISGYILDAKTGIGISYASVYDSASLASTLSDYYGYYSLKLNGSTKPVHLKVSREYYSDTTFSIVPSSNLSHDVSISRTPPPVIPVVATAIPKTDSIIPPAEKKAEGFSLLDSLISFEQLMQSRNVKEYLKRGGQISLLPFLSSNGKLTGNVINHFSLNIIGGYTGGTNGLEIGAAFNVDRQHVNGIQLAGAINIVGGNVKGVQTAGGINSTMGALCGLQLSGGSNFLMDTLKGAQLTGGLNISRGKVYGAQVAGGMNIAMRDLDGFQLAGGLNFTKGTVSKFQLAGGGNSCADTLKGLQLAGGFNFAKQMHGTQIAVLNIAKESKGFQLGVINIADTCNGGIPIGLFSFVRKGLHQIEFATTETGFLTLAFRTGVPAFHTILTAGTDPRTSAWTFGYGFGHDFRLGKKFNINLDGYAQHYNPSSFADYTSEWGKIDLLFEWKPVRYIAIAAGPTFNYVISDTAGDELQSLHAKPLFSGAPSHGYHNYGWIGAKFALRFF